MKLYSTNEKISGAMTERAGKAGEKGKSVSFVEAVFLGIAPDKGLFMPCEIPQFSKEEILEMKGKPFDEVAFRVLWKFLEGEISQEKLKEITKDAYNFDVPIEKLDEETYILRLGRGPTASFKDFAARFMARVMSKIKPDDKKYTVLVATSGDTGGAIGAAFKGLAGFKVCILYPENEVSSVQKRQMDSIGGNVQTLAIKGKFDQCQEFVKEAFLDPDLEKSNLTSANSINIGRILPQIIHYFYAYANVARDFEKIVFSVPSGNFGNSFACEMARRMGLPVEKIILAVNENNEFPKFFETGEYKKLSPSINCVSNAMNIGNPNNLVRYFDLYGGHLDKNGVVHKLPDIDEMKKNLFSVSISDGETLDTIKETFDKYGAIVEPHGAVGIAALNHYFKDNKRTLAVALETAHPSKFPEAVKKVLDVEIPIHPEMENIKDNGSAHLLDADYEKFKQYLLTNS